MTPAEFGRETIETSQWSDRELLLRTFYQACETNGSVRMLKLDIYGDPALEVVGLKQIAHENVAYREKVKATIKLAWAFGGILLAGLFTMLGLLLRMLP